MAEMKRATETFAWSGGLVHWDSELPADDPAVKAFPQFFEAVATDDTPAVPKRPGRPRKAASNG